MQHRRIIKRGPVVFATQEDGQIDPSSPSSQGLFLADTRFLSRFQIRLNGLDLILLGSSEEIMFESSFLHANQQLTGVGPRSVGILQHNRIEEDAVKISVTVANWATAPIELELSVEFDCDFFDSFEARGIKRMKRGQVFPPQVRDGTVLLRYEGLDGVSRFSEIKASPPFARFEENMMFFPIELGINQRTTINLSIQMKVDATPNHKPLDEMLPGPEVARAACPTWFNESTRVTTNNAQINAVLRRSLEDLEVLMLEFPDAWILAAGLPRFAVPFGRDAMITSLETLCWNPCVARDVLRFLAHRQGKEDNPWNYEQPGKIMHEMHTGELANLRETPYGLFYGTVDATPLFLVLGAEYLRWTGDLALFRELKPNFDAAWKWIDDYGQIDKSGYIQYQAHTPPPGITGALKVGLFNQGWKDRYNAVAYANGEICTDHPVALSEVQGEYYRALLLWADNYRNMPASEGMAEEAVRLQAHADALKEQFNRDFWMEEKQFFAMALDGHHRHVDSITSNPGECFWTRIIDDQYAEPTVKRLMSDSMMTSWGIRTVANTEEAYNPFSYHNGSIWPFENGLIAGGLKKYGYVLETQAIFDALIDASLYFEYRRWPELYCGVSREIGGVLARQPDASRPQAWSAGLIFLFVQTILGIAARPFSTRVDLTPALPSCLTEIAVEDLQIAGSSLSLRLVRQGNSVLLDVMKNPGDLEIVIHPATPRMQQLVGEHMPAVSH